jgi:hypothetical protein
MSKDVAISFADPLRSNPATSDGSMSEGFCIVQSKIPASARNSPQSPITAVEYGTLQDAYDHFREALFEGDLPQVLITLQRHPRARGYFSAKSFQSRDKVRGHVHEIALNPDSFNGRTDAEILSTLGHEMAHLWQQEHGHPGRGRYHNREWAAKMHSIGLMPSATGKLGGAVTGDSMSHYILEDGLFSVACRTFLTRYRLVWESATADDDDPNAPTGTTAKKQTRVKFTCPNCGHNAWAKPSADLLCGRCSKETGELIPMLDAAAVVSGRGLGQNPQTDAPVSDYDRVIEIMTEAVQAASNARIPKQIFMRGLIDFTAAVALGSQGEDLLRTFITRLEHHIEDFRNGTFPAG